MAYSVGDFKKMMKDAYKTAFGYRGATGFNIYRRYAGNKFRYCSECEVNELNAPGGFTHWIPKANPTDPKKVKYIGFWFGVYITDATGTRMDLHYIHFMYEDTTILGVCYEDFDNPQTQLQINSGITPTTTPMNVQLNDFIQAFK